MPYNQAYELLTRAFKEAQELTNRHWELVIACRTQYQKGFEYARKREQEHLEHAAYYEDRARSCEKALRDLAIMEEIRNEATAQLAGSTTRSGNGMVIWEPFDDNMIPDLPIQHNFLISNGRDVWVGQLDYGPHDSIKWYVGDRIIPDVTLMAYIPSPCS